jgi:2-hydroxy-3-keto-5-methylthiopentenyl-1-phosphate phosphatase
MKTKEVIARLRGKIVIAGDESIEDLMDEVEDIIQNLGETFESFTEAIEEVIGVFKEIVKIDPSAKHKKIVEHIKKISKQASLVNKSMDSLMVAVDKLED